MSRRFTMVAAIAVSLALTAFAAAQQSGQQQMSKSMSEMSKSAMKDGAPMTKAEKIANALSAAPSSIADKATILDWPEKDGMAPEVLRAGTNGWKCFPDLPVTAGNAPMCVDEQWMGWLDAYVTKKTPKVTSLGIGYMMAPGGEWASNTDPYATKAMPNNQWGHHGPHIMILVPDAKTLAGLSTDPKSGGPYVMWAGTPYAHIMAPTSTHSMK